MGDSDILIRCNGVSKKFCRSLKRSLWYGAIDIAKDAAGRGGETCDLRPGEFLAVDDVSFELKRGECLGLIGHNGAGKTTLLKMLNGLIKPDRGSIDLRGRVGALIALSAGFNPILSGRENIYASGLILGLTRREVNEKIEEIVDFAEIEHAIDAPVRTYSSGMQARLGFSVAAHMDPDILLIDEVLAVGDAAFRSKCLQFVEGIRARGGAYILVTHSFNQVLTSCPEALLMDKGKRVIQGPSAIVIDKALELQFQDGKGEVKKNSSVKREKVRENSPALLGEVSMSGIGGGKIVMGQPAEVKIVVEAERDIDDVTWAFYICTQDNAQRLVSKQSADSGKSWNLKKGKNVLRATTGPISLAAKRYALRVAISGEDRVFDMIGSDGDPIWIKVQVPEASDEMVRATVVEDIVWVDVTWAKEVESTNAAEAAVE